MQLIKLPEVLKMTSLSRSSVLKLVNDNTFPQPVVLIGRAKAWVLGEVEEWIETKISERDSC